MDRDTIAMQKFGKPYAELSGFGRVQVDDEIEAAAKAAKGPDPVRYSNDGTVTALNPLTGQPVWTSTLPGGGGGGSTAAPKLPQGPLTAADVAGWVDVVPNAIKRAPNGYLAYRQADGSWGDVKKETASAASSGKAPPPYVQAGQAYAAGTRGLANPAQPASSMQEAGAAVSPAAPPSTGMALFTLDAYNTPTTANIDLGRAGIQHIPLNSSNMKAELGQWGLTPTGKPADIATMLGGRAEVQSLRNRGFDGSLISSIIDAYRGKNLARDARIAAGDLSALLEAQTNPADWAMPNAVGAGSNWLEEEEPVPMAHGGSVTTGTPPYTGTLYKTDGGRMVPPWELKPSEYNKDAKGMTRNGLQDNPYNSGMPWTEWAQDGIFKPNLFQSRQFGIEGDKANDLNTIGNIRVLNGKVYGTDKSGRSWSKSLYGGKWEPIFPTDQWGRHYSDTSTGAQGFEGAGSNYASPYPGKIFSHFADGGSIMLGVDEPVIGMGAISQEPKFIAGEAGPERMDITPVGQPAPQPQPNQRLDVMLAGLRELSRGVSRRRQALQIPVGAMS